MKPGREVEVFDEHPVARTQGGHELVEHIEAVREVFENEPGVDDVELCVKGISYRSVLGSNEGAFERSTLRARFLSRDVTGSRRSIQPRYT